MIEVPLLKMQLEVPEFRNEQRTQTLEPADGIERQRQEASGKEGGHEMMDQSAESNYLKSSPTFPSRQFLIHPTPHEGSIPTIPGHFPFAALRSAAKDLSALFKDDKQEDLVLGASCWIYCCVSLS